MALSSDQKASRLFKKSLGVAETITTKEFFSEGKLGNYAVLTSQIWSESNLIEYNAPSSLINEGISGVTKRYILQPLTFIPGSISGGYDVSYYSENLIDAIPSNFNSGGSYYISLWQNDGSTPIYDGQGDWLVDTSAGVLTFYGTPPAGVTGSTPPKISFYKYVGAKGLGSGGGYTSVDFNSGTSQLIFNSGLTGEKIIDLSSLSGGTADGSGYTSVYFNSGTSQLVFDSGLTSENIVDLSSLNYNDTSLSTVISNETSNRISDTQSLSTSISGLTSETQSLSSVLSNEISGRTYGDQSLSIALSTELSNRFSSEASLSASIYDITSGNTGTIAIEDEYNTIMTGVTVLNFIGANVTTISAISGSTRRVNVYLPPPVYVSNFNTGSATVSSISTVNRYIALPTSEGTPYKIGDWVGGVMHSTIRNSVSLLSYSTAGLFSIFNLSSTFTATVYDADGLTPLATNSITLFEDGSYTNDNITITISNFATNADRYQANINITIAISTILPNGGRFSINLNHFNNGNNYTFTQNNIFKDRELLTATSGGTLSVFPSIPVIKQISGVYYYTTGSQWHVNLTELNNLNSNTYPSTQLTIANTNLFITPTISTGGESGGLTNWTRQYDINDVLYDKTDWTTNQTNQTNWNNGSGTINVNYATATIYDWVSVAVNSSDTYNYLIDTYVDSSDRNTEMFRTESNGSFSRLQSNLSTPWDSTTSLIGGDGLQVLGDRLVYPRYTFTSYLPSGGTSQPNYTGLSGDKYYYRKFNTNGNDISNGIILFSDYNINETDLLNGNVKFEISIDSGVSWYNLNSEYAGGILSNGDGCRIYPDTYGLTGAAVVTNSLRFTLGESGSSKYIHLKITFKNAASSKYIGGIDLTDGNWV